MTADTSAPSGPVASPTLLELVSVTKRFGRFTANDDVGFAVGGGEVVGLLGANGAGKTTAIRQALGLLTPTEGTVAQFGEIPDRRTRERIGYLPQGLGLWPDLSVGENLAFTAAAYGCSAGTGSADDVLPAGLSNDMDTLVRELPLGHQRRIGFAAALAHDPDLLVLDEPTSGVDALSRSQLWDVIRSRAERGTGVLVTTHFMDEARQCDRLLVMAEGRVVLRGTYDEIVDDRLVVQVDGDDWAGAFAALDGAGYACGLVGASVRVLGDDPSAVRDALRRAGVHAEVSMSAATLEETMVSLAGTTDPPT